MNVEEMNVGELVARRFESFGRCGESVQREVIGRRQPGSVDIPPARKFAVATSVSRATTRVARARNCSQ